MCYLLSPEAARSDGYAQPKYGQGQIYRKLLTCQWMRQRAKDENVFQMHGV